MNEKEWEKIYQDLMLLNKEELVQAIIDKMSDEDALHYLDCCEEG